MTDPYVSVVNRIRSVCQKIGRNPADVRLIAVSKTHPPQAIRSVYASGQRDFGENYADELAGKSEALADLADLRLIFIGQLQSNKIQKIVRHASEIQSVATEKHARYVNRYATEYGKSDFPVWIVVNAGDETSKQGARPNDVRSLADFISTHCPALRLKGLMAIPPATFQDSLIAADPAKLPDLYLNLRDLSRTIGEGKLSLGMSGDLEMALRAGSDVIRVGTAIFGARTA